MSDEWMAYARLKDYGYAHDTVCHKREFKNSISHACTNTVEEKENELDESESEESDTTESEQESDIFDEDDILLMTEFKESDSLGAGDGASASEFDPMEVD
ncbi:uncharacterized protein MONOS_2047 [Monocercomonoides exilis]|uniref:uncharacterized protein n=1 Tax=Monocercomonoides exilis TaxID=2049356 RepID=UPI00355A4F43|nr:hypothetical protein MONOS_2047 [Monocercomonoides exilis]|eukprot:MONOS_2047.1-p1 / transcript=MONOS_2047.1 / gene=MONOS_2047 / organism=Monocercomonoides_exilis_PA203 / gene_product=unspecified product / transcript_product=unspecified product / location=Mono_scaffold00040:12294-12743(-) / protein_length=101 / sequence_SO=supercontig / SO=protein_coding / is_pseudo=false